MKRFWWVPALLCAVAVWVAVWAGLDADTGLRSWWRLQSDLAGAERRIAALKSEVAALEAEALALVDEGFALEKAIREDLEYARSGETVVRLPRVQEKDIVGSLPGVPSSAVQDLLP